MRDLWVLKGLREEEQKHYITRTATVACVKVAIAML